MDSKEKCLFINDTTPDGGLFTGQKKATPPKCNTSWRISPKPFWISQDMFLYLESLGNHLLAFYQACNLLYFQSVRGIQPPWVSDYLDKGKPKFVIDYGRTKGFKSHLPMVIRPDILMTGSGPIASELDSVPGGIGFTANMCHQYTQLGYDIIGKENGIVENFASMIRSLSKMDEPTLCIVISEESKDYRNEMMWLGKMLNQHGLVTYVVKPQEIIWTEEGLLVQINGVNKPIDVLYRFFELFDLENVPNSELMIASVQKKTVIITPPLKSFLEEKMLFAFFHHPVLKPFWRQTLEKETHDVLTNLFPKTWILDSQPIPAHAVIPDLIINNHQVNNWDALITISRKERQFAIKPSGFSELAWGSKGIFIGHDLSHQAWKKAINKALTDFPTNPYILQEFKKGSQFTIEYYDFYNHSIQQMNARVRLCPYYFGINGKAKLSGILATLCSLDKKLIHGMVDAVIMPCAVLEKR